MLELTQTHCSFGQLKVQFSPEAVRIVLMKNNSVIVARAPNWKITWYRPEAKLFLDFPYDRWKQVGPNLSLLGDAMLGNQTAGIFVKKKESVFDGQQVVLFVAPGPRECDYSVIMAPKGSDKACRIIENFLRTPKMSAIPVSVKIVNHLERSKLAASGGWLETRAKFTNLSEGYRLMTSAIKKVTVASSELDCPKGYSLAKSERDIWMTADSKRAIDDLLNMPGLDVIDRRK